MKYFSADKKIVSEEKENQPEMSSESSEVARSQKKAEEILEDTLNGVVAGVVNLKMEDSDESMSEDILKELTSTVRIEEDSLAAENLSAQMKSQEDKPEDQPKDITELKSEAWVGTSW